MKLLEVFSIINEAQFLVERDVLNAKDVKWYIGHMAARIENEAERNWFKSQLFKYMINRSEDDIERVTEVPPDAPEWLVAKLQAGEPVFNVKFSPTVEQQMQGVADWLNAVPQNNLRLTWEDAVEAQAEWHRDIARQARVTQLTAEQMEGIVTIMEYDDGYRWVDVQTEVCLQNEGTLMGHCVGQGGYTAGVQEGTTKILSLRDANNNPHATIEGVSDNPIHIDRNAINSGQLDLFADKAVEESFVNLRIRQIKGKENKAVVRKYREHVQTFLTKFRISQFEYGGLMDLENSGLFKLKRGGYANVEDVGEEIARMEDGTRWNRVDSEYVELESYGMSAGTHAKWYLSDKSGRSIGSMTENPYRVISRISLPSNTGYNLPQQEKEKHKSHVVTAFNSKFEKNRTQAYPAPDLYNGFYNVFEGMGLGVNSKSIVNEPQIIGEHKATINGQEIYATIAGRGFIGNTNWVMSGDKIRARFSLREGTPEHGYTIVFDDNRSLPKGNIMTFVKGVEKMFPGDVNISAIQYNSATHSLADVAWVPSNDSELYMEEDGVRIYTKTQNADESNWYIAIDEHDHIVFSMNIENNSFKTKLVKGSIAGFYAIYVLERLEEEEGLDIGDKGNYSSFAREFLDETDWFQSDYRHKGFNSQDYWMVMNEDYPIHLTEEFHYSDGTEEISYEEDTTMAEYLSRTHMYDYGMESDAIASQYDEVYAGHVAAWDDEHEPDPEYEDGGPAHIKTDWIARGIGDEATVMHPISGGSMRIKK